MKSLLLFIGLVIPVAKGEKSPVEGVLFDVQSSQKLLYYLDSLDYLTEKVKKMDETIKVCDSLLESYKQVEDLLKKEVGNLEQQNRFLKEELKASKRKFWLERFIWVGGIILIIILMK